MKRLIRFAADHPWPVLAVLSIADCHRCHPTAQTAHQYLRREHAGEGYTSLGLLRRDRGDVRQRGSRSCSASPILRTSRDTSTRSPTCRRLVPGNACRQACRCRWRRRPATGWNRRSGGHGCTVSHTAVSDALLSLLLLVAKVRNAEPRFFGAKMADHELLEFPYIAPDMTHDPLSGFVRVVKGQYTS